MTRRELVLQAVMAKAATVPGIAATSLTRERATALGEAECPAMDIAPESESEPIRLGTGIDQRELLLAIRIHTAGNGAYALADPIVEAINAALCGDHSLGGLVSAVQPASTDFARDDADQTIGRTTLRYRIIYTTRRSDLTAKA